MSNGMLIAFDWGTTNARAALLDGKGKIIEERQGESGVGTFCTTQFEAQFDALTERWPKVPVIASGMIGSRQGWREAEYLSCPASVADLALGLCHFRYNDRQITIVPGLKLNDGMRFDVMRGEESQLAGFLALRPDFDGTIVMPGTHSKWVIIQGGTIMNFQTYMTGDMFEAFSKHTILRHSVSGPEGPSRHFAKKVGQLTRNKSSIESGLFALRAQQLLDGSDAGQLRRELSALLISAEMRAGQQDGFSLENEVILIGADTLTTLYQTAFEAIGVNTSCMEGTKLVWPALFDLSMKAGLHSGAST